MPKPRGSTPIFRAGHYADYEGRGYYLVVLSEDSICVGRYFHCSCYGSEEAVEDDLDDDRDWVWEGTAKDFMHKIVMPMRDLKHPERFLDPEDYNYDAATNFYKAFARWYWGSTCPGNLLDKDVNGERMLRLPRLYEHIHGVELTHEQRLKLGGMVAQHVKPVGKCKVPDVPRPINRFTVDQYEDLMATMTMLRV